MRCGREAWSSLRATLIRLLRDDSERYIVEPVLIPTSQAHFLKPVAVLNYTDFYASIHHATNVGKLFRPDQPLLPNYKWIPIGYHGRASSLVISGTDIRRPSGQTKPPEASAPTFGPTSQLDYELEVAAYIGAGNPLGEPIPIESADQHIFGLSLLNDWSARDIQSWEYQPLGPFLGKSFATSISPFVVPMEALLPFRIVPEPRAPGDPEPLPYLASAAAQCNRSHRRSLPLHGSHARILASSAQLKLGQSPRPLLDIPPNDRPPHQQRLQSNSRRPARQRNHLRPRRRLTRLPPRNHPARNQPNPTPQRRTTHLPPGRRRNHPPRHSAKNPASPASASANAEARFRLLTASESVLEIDVEQLCAENRPEAQRSVLGIQSFVSICSSLAACTSLLSAW